MDHPKCPVCKKAFASEASLSEHALSHHTIPCEVCNVSVHESKLKIHMENHKISDNYRKGLTKSKSKKKPSDSSLVPSAPRLNSYHIFCRAFREEKKKEFPELNMIGINALLREDWKQLTDNEKAAYKPPRASSPTPPAISTPSVSSVPTLVVSSPTTTVVNYTQSQIKKCDICGRMFFDSATLEEHKHFVHGHPATPLETEVPSIQVDVLQEEAQEQPQANPVQVQEPSDQVDVQTEEDEPTEERKYWLKVKSVLWPCRAIETGRVKLYNDAETVLDVDDSELRPFEALERIPRSRTAEWRRGYQKALEN